MLIREYARGNTFRGVVHLFAIYNVSSPLSYYPFALKFYFVLVECNCQGGSLL